jgi:hypothetical protein
MVEEDLLGASISGEEVDADEMERMQSLRNEVEEKVSAMLAEFNAQKALKAPPASTAATTTAAPAAATAAAATVAAAAIMPGDEVANKKPGARAPGGGPGVETAQKNPPLGVSSWNDYESLGEGGKLNLN